MTRIWETITAYLTIKCFEPEGENLTYNVPFGNARTNQEINAVLSQALQAEPLRGRKVTDARRDDRAGAWVVTYQ